MNWGSNLWRVPLRHYFTEGQWRRGRRHVILSGRKRRIPLFADFARITTGTLSGTSLFVERQNDLACNLKERNRSPRLHPSQPWLVNDSAGQRRHQADARRKSVACSYVRERASVSSHRTRSSRRILPLVPPMLMTECMTPNPAGPRIRRIRSAVPLTHAKGRLSPSAAVIDDRPGHSVREAASCITWSSTFPRWCITRRRIPQPIPPKREGA